ncbi:MAG: NTP transferase domain-containing protein [Desulfohalobiaceae bacterium]|nr:NTP transferase domain-containing protein [Desulfohalobiaceae bacterium]
MKKNIAAIVPAAGLSSRMGTFKPMLRFGDGQTVVERLINLFLSAGIADISVVTGHQASEISPLLAKYPVKEIYNPSYAEGMFSSLRRGIAGIGSKVEGVCILPVDIPLVRKSTLKQLVQSFSGQEWPIVYPVFQGKRGHPPLIGKDILQEVLDWSGSGGLRAFLEERDSLSLDVPVPDEGILLDMDHPGDYRLLRKRYAGLDQPTEEECLFLQAMHETAPGVRRHCRLVAETATGLGRALNNQGYELNLDLIQAAGLLHDLVRHLPDHAQKGAKILEKFGFPGVAAIIASHIDLETAPEERVSEAELVYLADKLVRGQDRVSLETRFLEKEEKFKDQPGASAAVRKRFARARKTKQKVEQTLGMSIEKIFPVSG